MFLFLFLPLLFALHALAPRAARNALLLAASLVFYAWGEGLFIGVMLFSIGINHRFGLWLGARGPRFDRSVLAFALVVNLGLLVLFKYAGFVLENLSVVGVDLEVEPIHLPIGISFFTFHSISYLVDIYRGKAKAQRGLVAFALYIALFPQLVAGPIVRYHELADQLTVRTLSLAGFAEGVRRFILGLAKKMLVANTVAVTANAIFAAPVYEQTDTHWNDRGGAAAAAAIAESEGLPVPGYAESTATGEGGDLARLLSLPSLLREVRPTLTPIAPLTLPRGSLLLVHDSFGIRMLPFLRRSFAQVGSVIARSPETGDLRGAPVDLVVEELVERDLIGAPPAGLVLPPHAR